jgi:VCBS repeat-containing protein
MKLEKIFSFLIVFLLAAAFAEAVTVAVTPNPAGHNSNLVCGVSPSGTYTYKWYRNGAFMSINSNTVAASYTNIGESWTCEVWQYVGMTMYKLGSSTVSVINNAPILAAIGNKAVNENSALSFSISATDADGDSISYSATGLPSGASFSGSTFSWTPDYTQAGPYTVTFTATDSNSAADSETITITVNNINRAPVLSTISNQAVNENSALTFSVSGSDPDGNSLTYTAAGLPSGASFSGTTFSWTPSYSQSGTYSVTFTVSDGSLTASQAVTITVNNINRAPVLSTISNQVVNENSALTFSVSATDADGDSISYSASNLPSGAIFSGSTFSWTPSYSQSGSYIVTFTVSDGALTASQAVTITVNDVYVPPIVVNNPPTLTNPSIAAGNYYTNDVLTCSGGSASDPDGNPLSYSWAWYRNGAQISGQTATTLNLATAGNGDKGDSIYCAEMVSDGSLNSGWQNSNTITVLNSLPAVASAAITPASPLDSEDLTCTNGAASDIDNDAVTLSYIWYRNTVLMPAYTTQILSNSNTAAGEQWQCGIVPNDGTANGAEVRSQTVAISALPDTEAPSVTNVDASPNTINQSDLITISALVTDNVAVDTVLADISWDSVNQVIVLTDIDSDDVYDAVFSNTSYSGTYTVRIIANDTSGNVNDTETVQFTVLAIPTAGNSTTTITEPLDNSAYNISETFAVNATISAVGGDLTGCTALITFTNDSVLAAAGSVTQNLGDIADGTSVEALWNVNAVSDGSSDIRVDTTCTEGGSSFDIVTNIIVNAIPVNNLPVANDDSAATNEDTAVLINVLANDSDVEGPVSLDTITVLPTNGAAVIEAGQIRYTPNANWSGIDTFTYRINDSDNAQATAVVTITVTPVNDAPYQIAPIPDITFDEDSYDDSLNLYTYFADIDNSTLKFGYVITDTNVNVSIDQITGGVNITATSNWFGAAQLTFIASDMVSETNATITVTVNSVNDLPIANNDNAVTNEDTAVLINVLANDSDVEGPVSLDTITVLPTNGAAVIEAGQIRYTPNANWSGIDTLTYRINDSDSAQATAVVTITVNPVNDAPVANNDAYSLNESTGLIVSVPGVLSNDTDVDSDPLSAILRTNAAHGNLEFNSNGSFTYEPAVDWNGIDSFTYVANDGSLNSTTATVTINVASVNDAPTTAGIPAQTIAEDSGMTSVNINSYFSDVDGDTLAYSITAENTSQVDCNIAGTMLQMTPALNWNGLAGCTVQANDGNGGTVSTAVSITVTPVPDYSVDIISNLYTQTVGLPAPATYTITITNTGDTADTYTLTVQNINSADQASLNDTSVTIGAGLSQTVTLTVSDSNPGTYHVTVTAAGLASDVTNSINTTVTTGDTGWIYNSRVNGTLYASQSTGIFANINDSFIRSNSNIYSVVPAEFASEVVILDSNITNSVIIDGAGDDYAGADVYIVNCIIINSTKHDAYCIDSRIENSFDPRSIAIRSIIQNTEYYNSNITDSTVTDSWLNYSSVDHSTVDGAMLDHSSVSGNSVITDSNLTDSTVDSSTVTDSTLTDSEVTDSTITDSTLDNSIVDSSTITDSNLINTNVTGSTLTNVNATNSVITDSTISNAVILNANITNNIIYSGTITINGTTYNATGNNPLNLSNPASWPRVSITGISPITGLSPLTVNFASSTAGQFNGTVTYSWNIDGTLRNGQHVTKDYLYAGSSTARTYSIHATVTATDIHGTSATATRTATITVTKPVRNSGGGGSGASSVTKLLGHSYVLDFTELNPQDVIVGRYDEVKFDYSGTNYVLRFPKLDPLGIEIDFYPGNVSKKLLPGESVLVNLDNNNDSDMMIIFNNMIRNVTKMDTYDLIEYYANLTFKNLKLPEVKPKVVVVPVVQEPEQKPEEKPAETPAETEETPEEIQPPLEQEKGVISITGETITTKVNKYVGGGISATIVMLGLIVYLLIRGRRPKINLDVIQ